MGAAAQPRGTITLEGPNPTSISFDTSVSGSFRVGQYVEVVVTGKRLSGDDSITLVSTNCGNPSATVVAVMAASTSIFKASQDKTRFWSSIRFTNGAASYAACYRRGLTITEIPSSGLPGLGTVTTQQGFSFFSATLNQSATALALPAGTSYAPSQLETLSVVFSSAGTTAALSTFFSDLTDVMLLHSSAECPYDSITSPGLTYSSLAAVELGSPRLPRYARAAAAGSASPLAAANVSTAPINGNTNQVALQSRIVLYLETGAYFFCIKRLEAPNTNRTYRVAIDRSRGVTTSTASGNVTVSPACPNVFTVSPLRPMSGAGQASTLTARASSSSAAGSCVTTDSFAQSAKLVAIAHRSGLSGAVACATLVTNTSATSPLQAAEVIISSLGSDAVAVRSTDPSLGSIDSFGLDGPNAIPRQAPMPLGLSPNATATVLPLATSPQLVFALAFTNASAFTTDFKGNYTICVRKHNGTSFAAVPAAWQYTDPSFSWTVPGALPVVSVTNGQPPEGAGLHQHLRVDAPNPIKYRVSEAAPPIASPFTLTFVPPNQGIPAAYAASASSSADNFTGFSSSDVIKLVRIGDVPSDLGTMARPVAGWTWTRVVAASDCAVAGDVDDALRLSGASSARQTGFQNDVSSVFDVPEGPSVTGVYAVCYFLAKANQTAGSTTAASNLFRDAYVTVSQPGPLLIIGPPSPFGITAHGATYNATLSGSASSLASTWTMFQRERVRFFFNSTESLNATFLHDVGGLSATIPPPKIDFPAGSAFWSVDVVAISRSATCANTADFLNASEASTIPDGVLGYASNSFRYRDLEPVGSHPWMSQPSLHLRFAVAGTFYVCVRRSNATMLGGPNGATPVADTAYKSIGRLGNSRFPLVRIVVYDTPISAMAPTPATQRARGYLSQFTFTFASDVAGWLRSAGTAFVTNAFAELFLAGPISQPPPPSLMDLPPQFDPCYLPSFWNDTIVASVTPLNTTMVNPVTGVRVRLLDNSSLALMRSSSTVMVLPIALSVPVTGNYSLCFRLSGRPFAASFLPPLWVQRQVPEYYTVPSILRIGAFFNVQLFSLISRELQRAGGEMFLRKIRFADAGVIPEPASQIDVDNLVTRATNPILLNTLLDCTSSDLALLAPGTAALPTPLPGNSNNETVATTAVRILTGGYYYVCYRHPDQVVASVVPRDMALIENERSRETIPSATAGSPTDYTTLIPSRFTFSLGQQGPSAYQVESSGTASAPAGPIAGRVLRVTVTGAELLPDDRIRLIDAAQVLLPNAAAATPRATADVLSDACQSDTYSINALAAVYPLDAPSLQAAPYYRDGGGVKVAFVSSSRVHIRVLINATGDMTTYPTPSSPAGSSSGPPPFAGTQGVPRLNSVMAFNDTNATSWAIRKQLWSHVAVCYYASDAKGWILVSSPKEYLIVYPSKPLGFGLLASSSLPAVAAVTSSNFGFGDANLASGMGSTVATALNSDVVIYARQLVTFRWLDYEEPTTTNVTLSALADDIAILRVASTDNLAANAGFACSNVTTVQAANVTNRVVSSINGAAVSPPRVMATLTTFATSSTSGSFTPVPGAVDANSCFLPNPLTLGAQPEVYRLCYNVQNASAITPELAVGETTATYSPFAEPNAVFATSSSTVVASTRALQVRPAIFAGFGLYSSVATGTLYTGPLRVRQTFDIQFFDVPQDDAIASVALVKESDVVSLALAANAATQPPQLAQEDYKWTCNMSGRAWLHARHLRLESNIRVSAANVASPASDPRSNFSRFRLSTYETGEFYLAVTTVRTRGAFFVLDVRQRVSVATCAACRVSPEFAYAGAFATLLVTGSQIAAVDTIKLVRRGDLMALHSDTMSATPPLAGDGTVTFNKVAPCEAANAGSFGGVRTTVLFNGSHTAFQFYFATSDASLNSIPVEGETYFVCYRLQGADSYNVLADTPLFTVLRFSPVQAAVCPTSSPSGGNLRAGQVATLTFSRNLDAFSALSASRDSVIAVEPRLNPSDPTFNATSACLQSSARADGSLVMSGRPVSLQSDRNVSVWLVGPFPHHGTVAGRPYVICYRTQQEEGGLYRSVTLFQVMPSEPSLATLSPATGTVGMSGLSITISGSSTLLDSSFDKLTVINAATTVCDDTCGALVDPPSVLQGLRYSVAFGSGGSSGLSQYVITISDPFASVLSPWQDGLLGPTWITSAPGSPTPTPAPYAATPMTPTSLSALQLGICYRLRSGTTASLPVNVTVGAFNPFAFKALIYPIIGTLTELNFTGSGPFSSIDTVFLSVRNASLATPCDGASVAPIAYGVYRDHVNVATGGGSSSSWVRFSFSLQSALVTVNTYQVCYFRQGTLVSRVPGLLAVVEGLNLTRTFSNTPMHRRPTTVRFPEWNEATAPYGIGDEAKIIACQPWETSRNCTVSCLVQSTTLPASSPSAACANGCFASVSAPGVIPTMRVATGLQYPQAYRVCFRLATGSWVNVQGPFDVVPSSPIAVIANPWDAASSANNSSNGLWQGQRVSFEFIRRSPATLPNPVPFFNTTIPYLSTEDEIMLVAPSRGCYDTIYPNGSVAALTVILQHAAPGSDLLRGLAPSFGAAVYSYGAKTAVTVQLNERYSGWAHLGIVTPSGVAAPPTESLVAPYSLRWNATQSWTGPQEVLVCHREAGQPEFVAVSPHIVNVGASRGATSQAAPDVPASLLVNPPSPIALVAFGGFTVPEDTLVVNATTNVTTVATASVTRAFTLASAGGPRVGQLNVKLILPSPVAATNGTFSSTVSDADAIFAAVAMPFGGVPLDTANVCDAVPADSTRWNDVIPPQSTTSSPGSSPGSWSPLNATLHLDAVVDTATMMYACYQRRQSVVTDTLPAPVATVYARGTAEVPTPVPLRPRNPAGVSVLADAPTFFTRAPMKYRLRQFINVSLSGSGFSVMSSSGMTAKGYPSGTWINGQTQSTWGVVSPTAECPSQEAQLLRAAAYLHSAKPTTTAGGGVSNGVAVVPPPSVVATGSVSQGAGQPLASVTVETRRTMLSLPTAAATAVNAPSVAYFRSYIRSDATVIGFNTSAMSLAVCAFHDQAWSTVTPRGSPSWDLVSSFDWYSPVPSRYSLGTAAPRAGQALDLVFHGLPLGYNLTQVRAVRLPYWCGDDVGGAELSEVTTVTLPTTTTSSSGNGTVVTTTTGSATTVPAIGRLMRHELATNIAAAVGELSVVISSPNSGSGTALVGTTLWENAGTFRICVRVASPGDSVDEVAPWSDVSTTIGDASALIIAPAHPAIMLSFSVVPRLGQQITLYFAKEATAGHATAADIVKLIAYGSPCAATPASGPHTYRVQAQVSVLFDTVMDATVLLSDGLDTTFGWASFGGTTALNFTVCYFDSRTALWSAPGGTWASSVLRVLERTPVSFTVLTSLPQARVLTPFRLRFDADPSKLSTHVLNASLDVVRIVPTTFSCVNIASDSVACPLCFFVTLDPATSTNRTVFSKNVTVNVFGDFHICYQLSNSTAALVPGQFTVVAGPIECVVSATVRSGQKSNVLLRLQDSTVIVDPSRDGVRISAGAILSSDTGDATRYCQELVDDFTLPMARYLGTVTTSPTAPGGPSRLNAQYQFEWPVAASNAQHTMCVYYQNAFQPLCSCDQFDRRSPQCFVTVNAPSPPNQFQVTPSPAFVGQKISLLVATTVPALREVYGSPTTMTTTTTTISPVAAPEPLAELYLIPQPTSSSAYPPQQRTDPFIACYNTSSYTAAGSAAIAAAGGIMYFNAATNISATAVTGQSLIEFQHNYANSPAFFVACGRTASMPEFARIPLSDTMQMLRHVPSLSSTTRLHSLYVRPFVRVTSLAPSDPSLRMVHQTMEVTVTHEDAYLTLITGTSPTTAYATTLMPTDAGDALKFVSNPSQCTEAILGTESMEPAESWTPSPQHSIDPAYLADANFIVNQGTVAASYLPLLNASSMVPLTSALGRRSERTQRLGMSVVTQATALVTSWSVPPLSQSLAPLPWFSVLANATEQQKTLSATFRFNPSAAAANIYLCFRPAGSRWAPVQGSANAAAFSVVDTVFTGCSVRGDAWSAAGQSPRALEWLRVQVFGSFNSLPVGAPFRTVAATTKTVPIGQHCDDPFVAAASNNNNTSATSVDPDSVSSWLPPASASSTAPFPGGSFALALVQPRRLGLHTVCVRFETGGGGLFSPVCASSRVLDQQHVLNVIGPVPYAVSLQPAMMSAAAAMCRRALVVFNASIMLQTAAPRRRFFANESIRIINAPSASTFASAIPDSNPDGLMRCDALPPVSLASSAVASVGGQAPLSPASATTTLTGTNGWYRLRSARSTSPGSPMLTFDASGNFTLCFRNALNVVSDVPVVVKSPLTAATDWVSRSDVTLSIAEPMVQTFFTIPAYNAAKGSVKSIFVTAPPASTLAAGQSATSIPSVPRMQVGQRVRVVLRPSALGLFQPCMSHSVSKVTSLAAMQALERETGSGQYWPIASDVLVNATLMPWPGSVSLVNGTLQAAASTGLSFADPLYSDVDPPTWYDGAGMVDAVQLLSHEAARQMLYGAAAPLVGSPLPARALCHQLLKGTSLLQRIGGGRQLLSVPNASVFGPDSPVSPQPVASSVLYPTLVGPATLCYASASCGGWHDASLTTLMVHPANPANFSCQMFSTSATVSPRPRRGQLHTLKFARDLSTLAASYSAPAAPLLAPLDRASVVEADSCHTAPLQTLARAVTIPVLRRETSSAPLTVSYNETTSRFLIAAEAPQVARTLTTMQVCYALATRLTSPPNNSVATTNMTTYDDSVWSAVPGGILASSETLTPAHSSLALAAANPRYFTISTAAPQVSTSPALPTTEVQSANGAMPFQRLFVTFTGSNLGAADRAKVVRGKLASCTESDVPSPAEIVSYRYADMRPVNASVDVQDAYATGVGFEVVLSPNGVDTVLNVSVTKPGVYSVCYKLATDTLWTLVYGFIAIAPRNPATATVVPVSALEGELFSITFADPTVSSAPARWWIDATTNLSYYAALGDTLGGNATSPPAVGAVSPPLAMTSADQIRLVFGSETHCDANPSLQTGPSISALPSTARNLPANISFQVAAGTRGDYTLCYLHVDVASQSVVSTWGFGVVQIRDNPTSFSTIPSDARYGQLVRLQFAGHGLKGDSDGLAAKANAAVPSGSGGATAASTAAATYDAVKIVSAGTIDCDSAVARPEVIVKDATNGYPFLGSGNTSTLVVMAANPMALGPFTVCYRLAGGQYHPVRGALLTFAAASPLRVVPSAADAPLKFLPTTAIPTPTSSGGGSNLSSSTTEASIIYDRESAAIFVSYTVGGWRENDFVFTSQDCFLPQHAAFLRSSAADAPTNVFASSLTFDATAQLMRAITRFNHSGLFQLCYASPNDPPSGSVSALLSNILVSPGQPRATPLIVTSLDVAAAAGEGVVVAPTVALSGHVTQLVLPLSTVTFERVDRLDTIRTVLSLATSANSSNTSGSLPSTLFAAGYVLSDAMESVSSNMVAGNAVTSTVTVTSTMTTTVTSTGGNTTTTASTAATPPPQTTTTTTSPATVSNPAVAGFSPLPGDILRLVKSASECTSGSGGGSSGLPTDISQFVDIVQRNVSSGANDVVWSASDLAQANAAQFAPGDTVYQSPNFTTVPGNVSFGSGEIVNISKRVRLTARRSSTTRWTTSASVVILLDAREAPHGSTIYVCYQRRGGLAADGGCGTSRECSRIVAAVTVNHVDDAVAFTTPTLGGYVNEPVQLSVTQTPTQASSNPVKAAWLSWVADSSTPSPPPQPWDALAYQQLTPLVAPGTTPSLTIATNSREYRGSLNSSTMDAWTAIRATWWGVSGGGGAAADAQRMRTRAAILGCERDVWIVAEAMAPPSSSSATITTTQALRNKKDLQVTPFAATSPTFTSAVATPTGFVGRYAVCMQRAGEEANLLASAASSSPLQSATGATLPFTGSQADSISNGLSALVIVGLSTPTLLVEVQAAKAVSFALVAAGSSSVTAIPRPLVSVGQGLSVSGRGLSATDFLWLVGGGATCANATAGTVVSCGIATALSASAASATWTAFVPRAGAYRVCYRSGNWDVLNGGVLFGTNLSAGFASNSLAAVPSADATLLNLVTVSPLLTAAALYASSSSSGGVLATTTALLPLFTATPITAELRGAGLTLNDRIAFVDGGSASPTAMEKACVTQQDLLTAPFRLSSVTADATKAVAVVQFNVPGTYRLCFLPEFGLPVLLVGTATEVTARTAVGMLFTAMPSTCTAFTRCNVQPELVLTDGQGKSTRDSSATLLRVTVVRMRSAAPSPAADGTTTAAVIVPPPTTVSSPTSSVSEVEDSRVDVYPPLAVAGANVSWASGVDLFTLLTTASATELKFLAVQFNVVGRYRVIITVALSGTSGLSLTAASSVLSVVRPTAPAAISLQCVPNQIRWGGYTMRTLSNGTRVVASRPEATTCTILRLVDGAAMSFDAPDITSPLEPLAQTIAQYAAAPSSSISIGNLSAAAWLAQTLGVSMSPIVKTSDTTYTFNITFPSVVARAAARSGTPPLSTAETADADLLGWPLQDTAQRALLETVSSADALLNLTVRASVPFSREDIVQQSSYVLRLASIASDKVSTLHCESAVADPSLPTVAYVRVNGTVRCVLQPRALRPSGRTDASLPAYLSPLQAANVFANANDFALSAVVDQRVGAPGTPETFAVTGAQSAFGILSAFSAVSDVTSGAWSFTFPVSPMGAARSLQIFARSLNMHPYNFKLTSSQDAPSSDVSYVANLLDPKALGAFTSSTGFDVTSPATLYIVETASPATSSLDCGGATTRAQSTSFIPKARLTCVFTSRAGDGGTVLAAAADYQVVVSVGGQVLAGLAELVVDATMRFTIVVPPALSSAFSGSTVGARQSAAFHAAAFHAAQAANVSLTSTSSPSSSPPPLADEWFSVSVIRRSSGQVIAVFEGKMLYVSAASEDTDAPVGSAGTIRLAGSGFSAASARFVLSNTSNCAIGSANTRWVPADASDAVATDEIVLSFQVPPFPFYVCYAPRSSASSSTAANVTNGDYSLLTSQMFNNRSVAASTTASPGGPLTPSPAPTTLSDESVLLIIGVGAFVVLLVLLIVFVVCFTARRGAKSSTYERRDIVVQDGAHVGAAGTLPHFAPHRFVNGEDATVAEKATTCDPPLPGANTRQASSDAGGTFDDVVLRAATSVNPDEALPLSNAGAVWQPPRGVHTEKLDHFMQSMFNPGLTKAVDVDASGHPCDGSVGGVPFSSPVAGGGGTKPTVKRSGGKKGTAAGKAPPPEFSPPAMARAGGGAPSGGASASSDGPIGAGPYDLTNRQPLTDNNPQLAGGSAMISNLDIRQQRIRAMLLQPTTSATADVAETMYGSGGYGHNGGHASGALYGAPQPLSTENVRMLTTTSAAQQQPPPQPQLAPTYGNWGPSSALPPQILYERPSPLDEQPSPFFEPMAGMGAYGGHTGGATNHGITMPPPSYAVAGGEGYDDPRYRSYAAAIVESTGPPPPPLMIPNGGAVGPSAAFSYNQPSSSGAATTGFVVAGYQSRLE